MKQMRERKWVVRDEESEYLQITVFVFGCKSCGCCFHNILANNEKRIFESNYTSLKFVSQILLCKQPEIQQHERIKDERGEYLIHILIRLTGGWFPSPSGNWASVEFSSFMRDDV